MKKLYLFLIVLLVVMFGCAQKLNYVQPHITDLKCGVDQGCPKGLECASVQGSPFNYSTCVDPNPCSYITCEKDFEGGICEQLEVDPPRFGCYLRGIVIDQPDVREVFIDQQVSNNTLLLTKEEAIDKLKAAGCPYKLDLTKKNPCLFLKNNFWTIEQEGCVGVCKINAQTQEVQVDENPMCTGALMEGQCQKNADCTQINECGLKYLCKNTSCVPED